jgi:hypothetical protein
VKDVDDAIVLGIVGFGIWECYKAYCAQCPSLQELRGTHGSSTSARQALRDADTQVGGLALIGGGVASLMLKSPWPLIVIIAAFGYMSWSHHDILAAPTITTLDTLQEGHNQSWQTQPTL